MAKSAFHDVFERYPRPIWVVTARDGVARGGLLATWVMPVSLDDQEPQLMLALGPHHYTTELVERSGQLAVHQLRRDQLDIALQFAIGTGRTRDKLADLPCSVATEGPPLLEDCRARAVGKVFAKLPTGTRNYYWVSLQAIEMLDTSTPLTDYELFARADAESRELLRKDRQETIDNFRQHDSQWRQQLPPWLVWNAP